MGFYDSTLLQTNPALILSGSQMQNKGLNNISNSIINSLNDLSKYKQMKEDNDYQNMLMQHLTDFQHQNQGTENERINPYAMSNGSSIMSYIQNPSQYVNGMTTNRAGSIWQKFMQERTNIANNQQNMLNSSIKNTAQQQQNIMQSYINQVGDTNKDGLIDVKDLNPTEQTALQGLYGSVANKLLGTAQQHNDILSKLALQDQYIKKRQNREFTHQDKIAKEQNARAILGSYQTLYNKAYNDYIKLSQYNPATMTTDQKLQLQNTINNMKNYASQIQHFQALLGGNLNSQQTNNIIASSGSQNNNIVNKPINTQLSSNNIIKKIIGENPVAEYPSNFIVNHGMPEPTHEQMMSIRKPDANWLVHSGQTNSDVAKQVNIVNDLYKNYNKYDKLETTNPFYSIVKNEAAKEYNSKVNDNHKVNYDNTAMKKLSDIYNYSLSKVVDEGFVDKNIAETLGTPELTNKPVGLLFAKISSQLDEAIANTTNKDAVKQLQAIKKHILGSSGKSIIDKINYSDRYNPPIFDKIKNSALSTADNITSLFGHKIYEPKPPSDMDDAMINFGKLAIKYVKNLSNIYGTKFAATSTDNSAKEIANNLIPEIKNYLSKEYNIPKEYIKNDYVKDFIYKNIKSYESGVTHIVDATKPTFFGSPFAAKPTEELRKVFDNIQFKNIK